MKITLCGSTRFMDAFGDWNVILTKAGHVVYSVCTSSYRDLMPDEDDKRRLDLIHLAKIDESDAIVVLNVDGYVGESTRREIEWARLRGKSIYWLEHVKDGLPVWRLGDEFREDYRSGLTHIPETTKYLSS